MDKIVAKIQNLWFYYKKHLLIALPVLLAVGYLFIQSAGSPEPDYHIGLVQAAPCSDTDLQELEALFAAQAEDVNGDGTILVQIHTYFVDLADDTVNAGVNNAETVAALDADLVGHVSGIFLLEDLETFNRITNNVLSDFTTPWGDSLFLVPRRDASDAYMVLTEKFS